MAFAGCQPQNVNTVVDLMLQNIARLQFRFASLTVVLFERSAYDPNAPSSRRTPADSTAYVRVDAAQPFAAAWNQAFSGRTAAGARGLG